jgi:hypothetical protein
MKGSYLTSIVLLGSMFSLVGQESVNFNSIYPDLIGHLKPPVLQVTSDLSDEEIQAYLTSFKYGQADTKVQNALQRSKKKWAQDFIPAMRHIATQLSSDLHAQLPEDRRTITSVSDLYILYLLCCRFALYRIVYDYAIAKKIAPCYLYAMHDTSIPLPTPDLFNTEAIKMLEKAMMEQANTDATISTGSLS